jgi:hypothetical protein
VFYTLAFETAIYTEAGEQGKIPEKVALAVKKLNAKAGKGRKNPTTGLKRQ